MTTGIMLPAQRWLCQSKRTVGVPVMPKAARGLLVWIAAYAIALQAILAPFAFGTANASPALDPFTVICHSEPGGGTADEQQQLPAPACNHCVLCNVTVGAATPDVPDIVAALVPCGAVEQSLSDAPSVAAVFHNNLARGPPATV